MIFLRLAVLATPYEHIAVESNALSCNPKVRVLLLRVVRLYTWKRLFIFKNKNLLQIPQFATFRIKSPTHEYAP